MGGGFPFDRRLSTGLSVVRPSVHRTPSCPFVFCPPALRRPSSVRPILLCPSVCHPAYPSFLHPLPSIHRPPPIHMFFASVRHPFVPIRLSSSLSVFHLSPVHPPSIHLFFCVRPPSVTCRRSAFRPFAAHLSVVRRPAPAPGFAAVALIFRPCVFRPHEPYCFAELEGCADCLVQGADFWIAVIWPSCECFWPASAEVADMWIAVWPPA